MCTMWTVGRRAWPRLIASMKMRRLLRLYGRAACAAAQTPACGTGLVYNCLTATDGGRRRVRCCDLNTVAAARLMSWATTDDDTTANTAAERRAHVAGAQRRHSARQRLSGSASIPLTDRRYLAAHSQRKYAVYIARYQILYAIQSEINIRS